MLGAAVVPEAKDGNGSDSPPPWGQVWPFETNPAGTLCGRRGHTQVLQQDHRHVPGGKPRHVFVQDYLVHGSNDQMTFKRYKGPNDREVS